MRIGVILVAASVLAGVGCAHHGSDDAVPDRAPEPDAAGEAASAPEPEPELQTPTPTAPRERQPGTIFRDELVRATAGGKPGYLMRELDPEAHRPAGRFQGWKINQVFPDDPGLCAAQCDLRPGDVILSVNGSPLEHPEQLSKLVESIGEMKELRVRIVRDGKLLERTYAIVD